MSSAMESIFGGGKAQTNFKDLERFFELQDKFSEKDKHGLFSSWVWEDGAQRQEANPMLQGGIESLMGRVSNPYEGYSSPSWMNDLLQSRGAHQFERMNMQMPQAGPMPPGAGGPMPPGAGGPMPPGAGGPMPPGAGGPPPGAGGGMPPGAGGPPPGAGGPPPGQSMPGRGGMMGAVMGNGMMTPEQQAAIQAASRPAEAIPDWAQNQRFGGLVGGIEGGIDAMRRNRDVPKDQRESVMANIFGALSGR